MRNFNGKTVELLAPAGNFKIFKALLDANCDAFYIGGKNFNMRMHRDNFNFDNEELKSAVSLAHARNKKIYVTVNNLLNESETFQLDEYLSFLDECNVDAIIIQDMAVLESSARLGLSLDIHSSVMMNVHNKFMVEKLKKSGVTRIVASRETSLESINKWKQIYPDMEFEYFVHGDMCSVNGSQCYYSGILFGQSSNRGRCMKPCRWRYDMEIGSNHYDSLFPLAAKDMFMYEHIPELISSGINSFKIEGRMRDAEYIKNIIDIYGNSIDRYLQDPVFYKKTQDTKALYKSRMRDFSTGFAFGNPGLDFINRRYEGTGFFYSTGKVFSKPIKENSVSLQSVSSLKQALRDIADYSSDLKPTLSVSVDTIEQLRFALSENTEQIYFNARPFLEPSIGSFDEISNLRKQYTASRLILSLPHMMSDSEFDSFDKFLNSDNFKNTFDGILVSDFGSLSRYSDIGVNIYGNYPLNLYNSKSIDYYISNGLQSACLSIEVQKSELSAIIKNFSDNSLLELIIHGSPTAMYLDLDLYDHISKLQIGYKRDSNENNLLYLIDDKQTYHPVYRDTNKKNHILLDKEICLIYVLKELCSLGIGSLRLEIGHYDLPKFKKTIQLYKMALLKSEDAPMLASDFGIDMASYSLGSLHY